MYTFLAVISVSNVDLLGWSHAGVRQAEGHVTWADWLFDAHLHVVAYGSVSSAIERTQHCLSHRMVLKQHN